MIDDVTQGRDLQRYEKLELTGLDPLDAYKERDPTLAKARSFLWSHWQARKRAYLILTLSSVDTKSSSHVFIEPDNSGRWRIYWRAVRPNGEVDDAPTDFSMAWVATGGWEKPGNPLPMGQSPDPVRDRLEFRDVCGEVVEEF